MSENAEGLMHHIRVKKNYKSLYYYFDTKTLIALLIRFAEQSDVEIRVLNDSCTELEKRAFFDGH